jgi:hypothetical protein
MGKIMPVREQGQGAVAGKLVEAGLSDAEAKLLYSMWREAPPGARAFSLPSGADARYATALKSKGYVVGFGDNLEITEKGRKVIVEIVTNEPNAFSKKASLAPYSQIRKKANGRPRQTHVKKASAEDRPFNLRKRSVANMRMTKWTPAE